MKRRIIFALSLLYFLVIGAVAQEVIVNGGFDDDTGWSVSCVNAAAYTCGTAEFGYIEDGPKYGEGPCLNLYVDPAAFSQVMVYQTVELEPNTTYVYSGYIKSAAGDTINLGVKNHGGDEVASATQSTEYELHSVTFTTGDDPSATQCYVWGPGEGGYADDLTLYGP